MPANQEEEQASQQAEEDGHRSQEEGRAVQDGEVEGGRAAGEALMEGKLLQCVQELDPGQIHQQHSQQTQA